jgi:hypothetical protein
MKRAFQATYFWGYLEGHNDQGEYRRQVEVAERLDKMEAEMRRFRERSGETA